MTDSLTPGTGHETDSGHHLSLSSDSVPDSDNSRVDSDTPDVNLEPEIVPKNIP